MTRLTLLSLLLLAPGCFLLAEPEMSCALAEEDVCAKRGQTCDLDRGLCVDRTSCYAGPKQVTCPALTRCYVNPENREGEPSDDPNGCNLNCMFTPLKWGATRDDLCVAGYGCDETTGRCALSPSCRPGTLDCRGGNCSPAGRCVAPTACIDALDCAGGFACELASKTCYQSCVTDAQCAGAFTCDLSTSTCR